MKNNQQIAYEFVTACERSVSCLLGKPVKLIMDIQYKSRLAIPVKLDQIRKLVATNLDFTENEILYGPRNEDLSDARSIICRIARDNLKCSLKQIAKSIGRADHSTVIGALKKSQNLEETDDAFRNKLRNCQLAFKTLSK